MRERLYRYILHTSLRRISQLSGIDARTIKKFLAGSDTSAHTHQKIRAFLAAYPDLESIEEKASVKIHPEADYVKNLICSCNFLFHQDEYDWLFKKAEESPWMAYNLLEIKVRRKARLLDSVPLGVCISHLEKQFSSGRAR